MQEVRRDGSEVLTPQVTPEAIQKAIEDPRNVRVTVHKPGSVFVSDGRKVRVRDDGALEPVVSKAAKKARRKAQKAARKRSRK